MAKFSLVGFIFTNSRVVFERGPRSSVCYPVIRTTGFLEKMNLAWAGLAQFKFVYLTNDIASHCDSSI